MAKLTEARETAVAGNVFVPKIPHWLLNKTMAERTPDWSSEDRTWLPGQKWCPAASALAGLPPRKHLLHPGAASRNFPKALTPLDSCNWSRKIPGRKSRVSLQESWSQCSGGKEEWAHERNGSEAMRGIALKGRDMECNKKRWSWYYFSQMALLPNKFMWQWVPEYAETWQHQKVCFSLTWNG